MKRRDVLKSIPALAGAASVGKLLGGCGDGEGGPGRISTIVLVMMENRSYDHVLGARSWLEGLPGDGLAEGMTNPDAAGDPVAVFEPAADELCCLDPPHGWDPVHVQINGGAMDGFLSTHQAEHPGDLAALQYLTRAQQPISWALADAYASCDRWFSSVPGPTWPNRFYWMSGQSMGMRSNDLPPEGFTAETIFHRLEEAQVPWRIYYGDLPFITLLGTEFDVDTGPNLWRLEDFFADAAAGRLPSVVYIDPPFYLADDHPPHHPILGQELIASVYNALATSPQWNECLLVVTYDEHGGFFDHVPPPTVPDDRAAEGFDQLGPRVPAIVAGPYVKQGHVSSVVRDHTSALKMIETLFGTAPLTTRSTMANDLSELLDEERLAAGDPRPPVELPAVDTGAWDTGGVCIGEERLGHDIIRIAEANPAWTARWNRKGELPAIAAAIRARAAARWRR